jgi:hypothetical protein
VYCFGRAPVASRQLPLRTIPARNGANGGAFSSRYAHLSVRIRDRIHNIRSDKTLMRIVMQFLEFKHPIQMETNPLAAHGNALSRRFKTRE